MNQTSPEQTKWNSEDQLIEFSQQTLTPFWQTKNDGFIEGQQGKKLYWISLTKPQHTKAIVVVNGRIESVNKYQELFWDLFQQGYDIYSYDHRGQGLSDRCCSDKQIGHVEHFDFYIKDLHHVLNSFDLSHYQQKFFLAHSMGGAITTRYLQTHPQHGFDGVALSAPMIGIQMQWYLRPFSRSITKWMSSRSDIPAYAPGQTPYHAKPFETNNLTSSALRYQWFRGLYEQVPDIQLGGPSSHWVHQSLLAAKQCSQQVQQINLPLLLLQASEDTIVDNAAQRRFINKLNKNQPALGQLVVIKGAKHELLCEADRFRNQALDNILAFYNSQMRTQPKQA
ncbi:alpha/beta fold hydrolase [Vibrio rumoiensis]|uniref:Lysophospholipase n=1 Tax=Vibrio rumoiensis 1S-45 TaxID=1188252 RepID=A0A1E5E362_9VIBR|nr:alpha/beta fold hydrolase [Vibrio rumoiensis]OEF26104.1 lysophospholipase [Vibrio rumoiensis 1S-45]